VFNGFLSHLLCYFCYFRSMVQSFRVHVTVSHLVGFPSACLVLQIMAAQASQFGTMVVETWTCYSSIVQRARHNLK